MAFGTFGRLWAIARKVEDLFKLQIEIRSALEIVDERLRSLEDRMVRLDADQTQVVTEARSAATAAATVVAGGILSDTVTRITRLEIRSDQVEQRRLPPPS